MDSQPSGNDSELLFIEAEEVYFSIKGNKVTPTGRGGNIISGIINFKGDIKKFTNTI